MSILKMPRKGQMEVFGLAVIVILLVIGMLFMVRFVILRPQSQAKAASSFVSKDMASNVVVYMLDVTVDKSEVCNKRLDITDLIRDCALGGGIRCLDTTPPSIIPTCEIAATIIEDNILKDTLDFYGHEYFFSVYKSSLGPDMPIEDLVISNRVDDAPCPGKKISGIAFIPLTPDLLNVQLDICT
ncbi:MAG: hypothetical protein U9R08_05470 [Nanoarchaeota archaeon]|nr:hypothetical protein [Nanoarchaeota archaeon]